MSDRAKEGGIECNGYELPDVLADLKKQNRYCAQLQVIGNGRYRVHASALTEQQPELLGLNQDASRPLRVSGQRNVGATS